MVKKRLSSVVIVSTVLAGTLVAPIATFADNYDSQIEQKNSEINDLKSKQSEAQDQIDRLETSINKINKKLDTDLEVDKIKDIDTSIVNTLSAKGENLTLLNFSGILNFSNNLLISMLIP